MKARWLPLLLLVGLCAGMMTATPVRANTTCTATVDSVLPFGTLGNAAGGPSFATLNVRVNCNTFALTLAGNAAVRACVGVGNGSGGTASAPWRTLVNAQGDAMVFQIYNDAGYSQVTGLEPGGAPPAKELSFTYSVPIVGGSGSATTQLYARVPAGQHLASGDYRSAFTGADLVLSWAYGEALLFNTASMPSSCRGGGSGSAGSFTATANVLPQCGSYLATDLDFGTVAGGISGNIDRTATLTLTCLRRTAYQVALDNGQNAAASGHLRRMRSTVNGSAYYLDYELYRDAARSQRWGNTRGVDTYADTGTGSAQQLTIHGRVAPLTGMPPAGTYRDLVQVTITY